MAETVTPANQLKADEVRLQKVVQASVTLTEDDDLLEVKIRLPRAIVEQSLLDARTAISSDRHGKLAFAELLLAGRNRLSSTFPGVRFGEPSWQMILDLYVSSHRGRLVDISSLCIASGVPVTTAFRHLTMLTELGYVTREIDACDRRRTFVAMSPRLKEAVDQWLDLELSALAWTF